MELTKAAVKYIDNQLNGNRPSIGMILGSGLGSISEQLTDKIVIPYADIPGFPELNVLGHRAQLSCGYIGKEYIACLEGRVHYYEGVDPKVIRRYIRTMKLIGCHTLIITNASGSLRKEVGPGSLVMVNDHINFQGTNPLIGPNDDEIGPRFFPIDNAYDRNCRAEFQQVANELGIKLYEGVYFAETGPNYETEAEIKAFRVLGADVVGMSTVPEVLVANHCGLKVVCIATVTNYATGLADEPHDHANVVKVAKKSANNLSKLILNWIKNK